jgi:hypothetical protein
MMHGKKNLLQTEMQGYATEMNYDLKNENTHDRFKYELSINTS